MTYTVNTIAELEAIVHDIVAGDVIIHKGMEHAQVVSTVQETCPDADIRYVHPGTDLYTLHGANVSVAVSIPT
jgi:hypothetical protein